MKRQTQPKQQEAEIGKKKSSRRMTERKQVEEELAAERDLLNTLINTMPDNVFIKDVMGRIVLDNHAHQRALGANALEQVMGKTDFDFFPRELAAQYDADEKRVIRSGEPLIDKMEPFLDKDHNQRWLLTTKVPLRDRQGNITGIVGYNHDFTQRKQAEELLRESEERYRSILENTGLGVFESTPEGRIIRLNLAFASMFGFDSPEAAIQGIPNVAQTIYVHPESRAQFVQYVLDHPGMATFENEYRRNDGTIFTGLLRLQALKNAKDQSIYLFGFVENITERKQAQEAIHQHVAELETLYESGLILGQLLTPKEIAQKLIELMSSRLSWHHVTIRLYHPEDETLELLAFKVPSMMSTVELQVIEQRFKTMIPKVGKGLSGWAVQHNQVVRVGDLSHDPRYVETEPDLRSGMYIPLKVGERVVGVISIESEKPEAFSEADERLTITLANQAAVALENARLHQETLHQVKRLEALHTIDRYIAGSFDQRLTLELLLTHTLEQLEVDAAVIFLLEPYQRTLQYTVGKGFHTHLVEGISNLKLGESFAGQTVLERRMVHINDPREHGQKSDLSKLWLEEGFKSQYSIPLIAKGQVKGALSVYHRKVFTPDPTWVNFLETLAGQAAIAVESMQLFNGLQQANMDLTVAYDATIEGWSQAMDLRDKETEGHTKRVTEMSVQLGRTMQLGEEYLVQLRRGALLHDIGKLGVPDHILLKADKLTDEEWQVMKKHPQFAYDMLRSVAYLHRALDIPYCHHERWDGTGYPRGLKGEEIPLAARIFTIVDVWDALTSDRPYRQAWSKPDALKYIREQSGKFFDPQVVDIFLKEFGGE